MIDIHYCCNILHVNRPLVVTAGDPVSESYCILGHLAQVKKDIDEPNYDGSSNFETADGTIVGSVEEWFDYLREKYLMNPNICC